MYENNFVSIYMFADLPVYEPITPPDTVFEPVIKCNVYFLIKGFF